MPCGPSDRWGLPGALIPASSHAPRATVRAERQPLGRNAAVVAVGTVDARIMAGGDQMARSEAGPWSRRDGAAGLAGERRLGLHRRGPAGKG